MNNEDTNYNNKRYLSSQNYIPLESVTEPDSYTEVFQLIDLVGKKLKQIQRQTIGEANLTPPQYLILMLLWEKDGRPLKELASACFYTRPTITGVVDTLEKKGLVTREPNPDDRRSLLVKLTDKGRLLIQSTPTLENTFKHCCYGLEPDEFEQLGRLLRKLDDSLLMNQCLE